MSDLPIPSASVSLVATLDPAEAAVNRFLARVRALTPAQWGELDAIAQRLGAHDPISRWRAVRRSTAAAGDMPLLRDVMTVLGVAVMTVYDVVELVLGESRTKRLMLQLAPAPPSTSRSDRLKRAFDELEELAEAQPGGPGNAFELLGAALLGVWMRPRMSARAFAEWYEPVEPVIPSASL